MRNRRGHGRQDRLDGFGGRFNYLNQDSSEGVENGTAEAAPYKSHDIDKSNISKSK